MTLFESGDRGRTRFENEPVKKDQFKVLVHHDKRSCNYAEGRFVYS